MNKELAVIIGRFQVPYLTAGHIDFINRVLDINENVLVVLGEGALDFQPENVLTPQMRMEMFQKLFPYENLSFMMIKDVGDNEIWSRKLDASLNGIARELGYTNIKVYGSRDSFLNNYTGTMPAESVPHRYNLSGTALRKLCADRTTGFTDEFRAGVIWLANNLRPVTYPTVDAAIYQTGEGGLRFLMARKATQTKFRFVGGFSEPESASYEDDVMREVLEETNLITKDPRYICSMKVDDWRLRRSPNKIKTSFFCLQFPEGQNPYPKDDLKGGELKWFRMYEMTEETIMPEHVPLIQKLRDYILK